MAGLDLSFWNGRVGMFSDCRQRVPCDNRLIALDADLDRLVQKFFAAYHLLQDECEQVALQCRNDLGHDDDQAGMDLLIAVEFSEIARVVGYECVVLRNNAGHQIPILFTAQSQPVDMEAIVTVILSNGHERGVQAFINQELHDISCREF